MSTYRIVIIILNVIGIIAAFLSFTVVIFLPLIATMFIIIVSKDYNLFGK